MPPISAPLTETIKADICVIGAGLAGLTTALEAQRRGLEVVVLEAERVGAVEHLFTHRRLELEVFRARIAPSGRVRRSDYIAHRWVAPDALLDLAHAGATRKALTLLGVTGETSARAARRRDER